MVYAYIYCVKCVAKCVVSPVANFYEFSGDDSLEGGGGDWLGGRLGEEGWSIVKNKDFYGLANC